MSKCLPWKRFMNMIYLGTITTRIQYKQSWTNLCVGGKEKQVFIKLRQQSNHHMRKPVLLWSLMSVSHEDQLKV